MHSLQPVYKPISWEVNPPEIEDTPKNRRLLDRAAKQLAAAMRAGHEAQCSTSVPVKRNRVAEEMGDEYVEGFTFEKFRFELEMLKP